jgi:co-chaperonin GroES (HSP10)
MPNHFLEPASNHILVVDASSEITLDGISLPANVRQQDMVGGTVMFVGPDVKHTKPNDQVLYGPYAGKTVVFNGSEFRLLLEGHIELYVRKSPE